MNKSPCRAFDVELKNRVDQIDTPIEPFWIDIVKRQIHLEDLDPTWFRFLVTTLFKQAVQGFPCLNIELYVQTIHPRSRQSDRAAWLESVNLWIVERIHRSPRLAYFGGWIYLATYFELENRVAENIYRWIHAPSSEVYELAEGSKILSGLNKEQSEAVISSLHSNFFMITGGPGTGKTFTAARVVQAHIERLQKNNPKFGVHVALLAPTGKACVHLMQTFSNIDPHIHLEAMTLHRFFIQGGREGGYHSLHNPPPYQLVLVDEASMMDSWQFSNLFESLHEKTTLILMGDPNQLPPVKSPGLFSALMHINHPQLAGHRIHLLQCLRAQMQELVKAGEIALKGSYKDWQVLIDSSSCIKFHASPDESAIPVNLLCPPSFSSNLAEVLKQIHQQIILCGVHHGPWGTQVINENIYRYRRKEVLLHEQEHLDIPIMATVNQPEIESVNGLMGIIRLKSEELQVSPYLSWAFLKAKEAYFMQEGNLVCIPCLRLEKLQPAWAITVHKSQGSEFNCINLLLSQQTRAMSRSLFYTALTRAREKAHIWSISSTLERLLEEEPLATSAFEKILKEYFY